MVRLRYSLQCVSRSLHCHALRNTLSEGHALANLKYVTIIASFEPRQL